MSIEKVRGRLAAAVPRPWTMGLNFGAVIAPADDLKSCMGGHPCPLEKPCTTTCMEAYGGELICESASTPNRQLITHAPDDLRLMADVIDASIARDRARDALKDRLDPASVAERMITFNAAEGRYVAALAALEATQ